LRSHETFIAFRTRFRSWIVPKMKIDMWTGNVFLKANRKNVQTFVRELFWNHKVYIYTVYMNHKQDNINKNPNRAILI
jgi:hypothetical protein